MKYKSYYNKDYFEEYARLCLNHTENFNMLHREQVCNSDRPDLISNNNLIGVEVTQAISENQGKQNKVLSFDSKNKNESVLEKAKQFNMLKDLKFIGNIATIPKTFDEKEIINEILKSIKKKTENLNKKGFNKYPQNNLFIFKSCFKSNIEKATPKIQKLLNPTAKNPIVFNFIYILNDGSLTIISKNNITEKTIPRKVLKEFKNKALYFAKDKNLDKKIEKLSKHIENFKNKI